MLKTRLLFTTILTLLFGSISTLKAQRTISFSSSEVVVNEGIGNASFAISTQGNGDTASITLRFKSLGIGVGLAERPADFLFTDTSFTVNFSSSINFTVPIVDDLLKEGEEAFLLELINPSNGALIGTNKTLKIRITDNEKPLLKFSLPSQQFAENAGTVRVSIEITDPNSQSVKADIALKIGSAKLNTDYTYTATSLFIPGGSTDPFEVELTIFDDLNIEPTKNLFLQITNLVNADTVAGGGISEIKIDDNDFPRVFFTKVASKTFEGVPSAAIMLALDSINFEKDATVSFATINNTANNPSDYTNPATTNVVFPAGTKGPITINIPITDDALVEDVENFDVVLVSAINAEIGAPAQHRVTLVDDDQAIISLEQNLAPVTEGNAGNTNITVSVNLDVASSSDVTADIVIIGGTASKGVDFDYSPSAITIPAGSLNTTFTVSVVGDLLSENDENAIFTLQNISNTAKTAAGSDTTSLVIIDEDGPTFKMLRPTQNSDEGVGIDSIGVVAINPHPSKDYTVEITTTAVSATDAIDYSVASATATLTFTAAGPDTLYLPVNIVDDAIIENTETIAFALQNASVGSSINLLINTDTLSIIDNDAALMSFTNANYLVIENLGPAVVSVVLSQANPIDTLVADVVLTGGNATQGTDFTYATSQTVTFLPDSVGPINITIPVIDDAIREGDESFFLTLIPRNAKTLLGTPSSSEVTLQDDDIPRPIFRFELDTQGVVEGADTVFVNVLINESSTVPVTVDLVLQAGAATNAVDFAYPATQTLTFNPGVLTQRLKIEIIDDSIAERNEDFDLVLSNPTNSGQVGPDSIHKVVIVDNELTFAFFEQDTIYVNEAAFADTMIIRLNGYDSCFVQVDLIQGTATQILDYLAFNTSLVGLSETIDSSVAPLPIIPDVFREANETYQFRLSTPALLGCRVGDRDTITIIIIDDDKGGAVEFEFENLTVSEDLATFFLNVAIDSLGLFNCNVSIEVLNSSIAKPVDDYLFNGFPLEYTLLGDQTQSIEIPIVNDNLIEGDEHFFLRIKPASDLSKSCLIGARDTIDILILDNDFPQPIYRIAQVKGTNTNGVLDSLNVKCELRGVSHGLNYAGFNNATNFFMQDTSGGINVRLDNGTLGYVFKEGDSVHVIGVIKQLEGLAYIEPQFINRIAQNRPLQKAQLTNLFNESNEGELIELQCLKLLSPSQWKNQGDFFEAQGTNSAGTFRIRIPNYSSLYGTAAPTKFFNIKGIVSQEDNFGELNDGYFIWARNYQDLTTSVKADFKAVVTGNSTKFTNLSAFGTSFYWDFGDGLGFSIDANPTYAYPQAGTYTVTLSVTRASGCFDVIKKEVVVGRPTSITQVNNPEIGLSVYPNPAQDRLLVKADVVLDHIAILDISGKTLLSHANTAKELALDVSQLAKGIYLLRIETKAGVSISRIIKE